MADPNITLMGATYPSVSGVSLPKSGGGTATFPWVEGSETKTENGTYDVTRLAEIVVNVPSSSGGSIVTGTFTGSAAEKGTAKAITVPYSGAGYPVALLIYPTAGAYKSGTSIYTSTQYRAIVTTMAIKCDISTTPDYTNNAIQNKAYVISTYKGSSSDSAVYAVTTISKNYNFMYRYSAEGTAGTTVARFYNSGINLTVYIALDDGSEYGFLAGTEYTYQIVYSS